MKNRNPFVRLIALVLAVVLTFGVTLTPAEAAGSAAIKKELDALKSERTQIQNQINEIEEKKDATWDSIEEKVAYKNSIDEQIFLLYSEVENLNEQITTYTRLIADTQMELDEAQGRWDTLNAQNKERVRAMEEEGEVSIWSVLFKANSFTDFIDSLNMIEEIQAADQRRLEELDEAARQVEASKQTLKEEKDALLESMSALEASQAELDEKRAETDQILAELTEENKEYEDMLHSYDAEKAALLEEIAAAEVEYTKALAAEEEARKKAEAEANKQTGSGSSGSSGNSGGSSGTSDKAPNPGGWLMPVSYTRISSSYGYRSRGWHNGVDFAAPSGTPIYATRSGTVTTAKALKNANGQYYSYGNYVVINHGDGFSSLYAHMNYYVVSAGERVSRGQLIGYVGSTGNSTGPHLHLTFFYNGSTVNPMNYL